MAYWHPQEYADGNNSVGENLKSIKYCVAPSRHWALVKD